MPGVKLYPWLQSFSPTDPALDALGEEMARLGVPVEFHDGTPPNSSPMQIAYFVRQHPGTDHDMLVEPGQRIEYVYVNKYLRSCLKR